MARSSNGKKVNRREKVLECFSQKNPFGHEDWTIMEVCKHIGETPQNAKFVSSLVTREWNHGRGSIGKAKQKRVCSVSNRSVTAYFDRSSAAPQVKRRPALVVDTPVVPTSTDLIQYEPFA